MARRAFLTAHDLKALSDFPTITNREAAKLEVFVERAHAMIRGMGNLPEYADLGVEEAEYMRRDMRLAHFLLAERLVLSNPATPSAATGLTFEKIGRYEYSRARTTDRSGETIQTELVTKEIADLVALWADDDEEEYEVSTTHVFYGPTTVDADGHGVVVHDDFDDLAYSIWRRSCSTPVQG